VVTKLNMNRLYLTLALLTVTISSVSVRADELEFMVLDMKGKKETIQQWNPLISYLSNKISQKINLVPIPNAGFVRRSVGRDILLTNPVSAVTIQDTGEFEIVLTLEHIKHGDSFAGVIIVHRDSKIESIAQLANKKVGVVNLKFAAGGFLFQASELVDAGLDPDKDFSKFKEMYNQKGIVKRVIQKQIDAGFIRTGLLESLRATVDVSQLKILNHLENEGEPPRSTALYPNWALLVNKNVSSDLRQEITEALLAVDPNSEAARAGKMKGFVKAADYSSIKAIMSRLKVYKFNN